MPDQAHAAPDSPLTTTWPPFQPLGQHSRAARSAGAPPWRTTRVSPIRAAVAAAHGHPGRQEGQPADGGNELCCHLLRRAHRNSKTRRGNTHIRLETLKYKSNFLHRRESFKLTSVLCCIRGKALCLQKIEVYTTKKVIGLSPLILGLYFMHAPCGVVKCRHKRRSERW